jgi:hypothetical protein
VSRTPSPRTPALAEALGASLRRWGIRPRTRAGVYLLALGLAATPLAMAYAHALDWVRSSGAALAQWQPANAYNWFRIYDGTLTSVAPGTTGPDIVGLGYATMSTRIAPPGKTPAFVRTSVALHEAVWAEPDGRDPPDHDLIATSLLEAHWMPGDPPPTISRIAPGLWQAEHLDSAGVRAFAMARARQSAKPPWPWLAGALLAAATLGETLAIAGRRSQRQRQGACPLCGYPRLGLPTDRCPECGSLARAHNPGNPPADHAPSRG